MADEGYSGATGSGRFVTKKCPECYTYLPLHTKKCPSCTTKLGGVDKLGFAIRTFDWAGYVTAIIAIAGLVVFIWWGFFRD